MTPDQLRMLINDALSGGCGIIISYLYQLWLADIDHNPPPLTARLAVFALCMGVPTALYSITVAFGWSQFDVPTLVSNIVAAFTASTLWHGVTQLRGKPANPVP